MYLIKYSSLVHLRNGIGQDSTQMLDVKMKVTAMKLHTTIWSLLVHPKDKLKIKQQTGVVYQIPCKQREKSYVGETARVLQDRISEHEQDVRLNRKGNNRKENSTNLSYLIILTQKTTQ